MGKKLPRALSPTVSQDLKKKMVLVAGPRQCGKTALAQALVEATSGAYYNFDIESHRRIIKKTELDEKATLWALDEIHKWRSWRNWLKGLYDEHSSRHQILVTGSARLDLYHRRGDSLAGRHFLHHLHPLTVAELTTHHAPRAPMLPKLESVRGGECQAAIEALLHYSGFPEPFLEAKESEYNRWQMNYQRALLREDFASLEAVRDLHKVELLEERLPALVGSPLSLNALSEDVEVSFKTARAWVAALERVYSCLRIAPFGAPKVKAVRKEQKLYLWDWARIPTPGARLENLVAIHLVRWVDWLRDVLGQEAELRFFRTVVGHEVDFIILRKQKPWCAIEVKSSVEPLDRGVEYFVDRFPGVTAFQLHLTGSTDTVRKTAGGNSVRCAPLAQFLAELV